MPLLEVERDVSVVVVVVAGAAAVDADDAVAGEKHD